MQLIRKLLVPVVLRHVVCDIDILADILAISILALIVF